MIPGIPQGQEYTEETQKQESGIRKDQECRTDIKNKTEEQAYKLQI